MQFLVQKVLTVTALSGMQFFNRQTPESNENNMFKI